jgi:basic membrane protein A
MNLNKCAFLPLIALVLAACNNSAPTAGSGFKVGVVFDKGGRGDKSFNDSAWAGVQKAEKELNIPDTDVKTVDSKNEKDYEGNLTGMAEAGCNMIFAVGFAQGNALQTVAPKYPNIHFAIIDGQVDLPNVRSIQFSEEQGSYLAGYLAGLVTKTGKIGFVGGMKIALIEKFQAGYEAGARAANPKIQILPAKYTESWDDTQLGKAAAETLYNGGADIVYHAAGRCGLGVIEAAKEANKFAIGVDSDQDGQAPGNVLTSMVKHVDTAVFQTIKDAKDGKFTPGVKRYDLADGGVGLTDFQFTKNVIGEANIAKVKDQAKKIVSGQIKVPATL